MSSDIEDLTLRGTGGSAQFTDDVVGPDRLAVLAVRRHQLRHRSKVRATVGAGAAIVAVIGLMVSTLDPSPASHGTKNGGHASHGHRTGQHSHPHPGHG